MQLGAKKLWDRSAELYDSWNDFSTKAGEPGGTKTAFGSAMRRRGFKPEKIEGGRGRSWFIRLKPEPPSRGKDFNKARSQDDFG